MFILYFLVYTIFSWIFTHQYCGPGTTFKYRLARDDLGINPLDVACKEHDIAYAWNPNNLSDRHAADFNFNWKST